MTSGAVEPGDRQARAAGHVYERRRRDVAAHARTFGDDKDRVLMKSDGVPTYFAADIAYIEHKFARGHDRLIYISAPTTTATSRGSRRGAAFGYDPDAVEVPINQMVTCRAASE